MAKSRNEVDAAVAVQNPIGGGKKLVLPLALEDGRVPGLFRNLSFGIAALVIGFLVWANTAQIREFAIAVGEITPTGLIKSVHHLEGGIVAEVLVEEGESVGRDDPLVRLRPIAENSDLEQLQFKQDFLSLRKQRILSLLRSQNFDVDPERHHNPEMAQDQVELFRAQNLGRQQQDRIHQARIDQRMAEYEALSEEAKVIKAQMERTHEHFSSLEGLFEEKLISRSALQTAANEYEESSARYIGVVGRREAAETAVSEAHSLALEAQVKWRETLTSELSEVSALLAEAQQLIAKQSDKVDRLLVRAPSDGVVQSLNFGNAGEVVLPGQLVAEIIPTDDEMIATIRLDPADIGHIHEGYPVEVSISTFDRNQFGYIEGEIETISATTLQSDSGEVFYKATVRLADDSVGLGDVRHQVSPGMVVQASITTGAKSLIEYMLKPVYGSLEVAFSER